MGAMEGLLAVRIEKKGHYSLGDAIRPLGPRSIYTGHRVARCTASWWLGHLGCRGYVRLHAPRLNVGQLSRKRPRHDIAIGAHC